MNLPRCATHLPAFTPNALSLALWALFSTAISSAAPVMAAETEGQPEIELEAIKVTGEQLAEAGDPQTEYTGKASRAAAGIKPILRPIA